MEKLTQNQRSIGAMTAIAAVSFVLIWIGGTFIASTQLVEQATGTSTMESSGSSPLTALFLLAEMVVVMGIFLVLIKYGKEKAIYLFYLGFFGYTVAYIALIVAYALNLNGDWAFPAIGVLFIATPIVIHYWRAWYVTNTIGILVAMGMVGLFSMWLNLDVIILLFVLGIVGDYIAVHVSGHMLQLMDAIPDNLPLALRGPIQSPESGRHPKIGLGDMAIPSVLLVHVAMNPVATLPLGAISIPFGVIGVAMGILVMLLVVEYQVATSGAQAGLPYLCLGAMGGLEAAILITGTPLGVI